MAELLITSCLVSIVVSIPACHAGDPGSIPGLGDRIGESIAVTWPSGLRRQLKALVREGVGSNPTAISQDFAVMTMSLWPSG